MYQGFIMALFEVHGGHIQGGHTGRMILRFTLVLATCIVLCTISRYVMELPVQRLRRYVVLPKRKQQAAE